MELLKKALSPVWQKRLDVYAMRTGRSGQDQMADETIRSVSVYLAALLTETNLTEMPTEREVYAAIVEFITSHKKRNGKPLNRSSMVSIAMKLGGFFTSARLLSQKDKEQIVSDYHYKPGSQWSKYDVTDNDIQNALLAIWRKKGTHAYTRARNAAIVTVLATVGIRVGSIVELRMDDLVIGDDGWTLMVRRKKNASREAIEKPVPYAKMFGSLQAEWALKAFMDERAKIESDYLFCAGDGRQLSTEYLRGEFGRIAQIINVEHLNPHAFRHHAITRVAHKHGALHAQILADHSRITTTQLYINNKSDALDMSSVVL